MGLARSLCGACVIIVWCVSGCARGSASSLGWLRVVGHCSGACWAGLGRALVVVRCGQDGVGAWLDCVAALECLAFGWGVAGQRSGWESGVACGAQAGLAWQGSGRRAMSGDGHRGEGSAGLGTQLCCAVLLVLIPSSPWSESVRGAACDSLLSASVRAGH